MVGTIRAYAPVGTGKGTLDDTGNKHVVLAVRTVNQAEDVVCSFGQAVGVVKLGATVWV